MFLVRRRVGRYPRQRTQKSPPPIASAGPGRVEPGGLGPVEPGGLGRVELGHVAQQIAGGQSPTYGKRPMNRARLMARHTACWLAAVQPDLRRPTIRPWRLINFFSNSTSL